MFFKKYLFKIETCREKAIKEKISYLREINKKYFIFFRAAMRPYNDAIKKIQNDNKNLSEDIIVKYIIKKHLTNIEDKKALYNWAIKYRADLYTQTLKCEKINNIELPIKINEYDDSEIFRLGKIIKKGFLKFQDKYGVHPFLYVENKESAIKRILKNYKLA